MIHLIYCFKKQIIIDNIGSLFIDEIFLSVGYVFVLASFIMGKHEYYVFHR